jgi:hypothetical protein
MIKYFLAVVSVIFLVAAGLPSEAAPSKAEASKAAPAKAGTLKVPSEIAIPASVGEVRFRHQMHIDDLSIKCGDCHHQINAKKLNTPHPDYFGSSWINCKTCHDDSEKIAQKPYLCSECHRTRPKNIADETLVQKWWFTNMLDVPLGRHGQGSKRGCEKCHSGKRRVVITAMVDRRSLDRRIMDRRQFLVTTVTLARSCPRRGMQVLPTQQRKQGIRWRAGRYHQVHRLQVLRSRLFGGKRQFRSGREE